ncbi:RHS repeat-associated core domain-containing protein [Actinoplanes sp. GCM10030250]|uniref:RHS repeat-associated core domain-containing protein n=1 Tax=Actinoplanes sp. GCM10030250 TaxID=3273376 RepID=UPI00361F3278
MSGRGRIGMFLAGLLFAGQLSVAGAAAPAAAAPPNREPLAQQGPVAAAASAPADFAYDGAGQLRGVSHSSDGAGAAYSYDAAGNPTGVTRSAAGALTVSAITPSRAPVGASVTIAGTGFAATTGANSVSFNGAAATVTAASATRLVATVPTGATSGTVTVATGTASTTSTQILTVTAARLAPSISSFSPAGGAAGTAVTIAGSGFSGTPEENNVSFGRTRARVTAAGASSLTVVVPGAAVSGRISVATPGGTATSSTDFTAVTTPFGAGDIGPSVTLSVDGAATTVNFSTAGKVAVLRYAGVKGDRLSLGLTGSTVGDVRIYGYTPFGGSIGRDEFDAPWLVSRLGGGWTTGPLPFTGTYQVVLQPVSATATGTITATLSKSLAGALNLDGAAPTINLSRAGLQAELTFDSTGNQRVGLGVSGVTLPSDSLTIEVRDPHGVPVVFPRPGTYGYWRHVLDLPDFDADFSTHAAGRYTVLVRARDQATGSVTLTLSTARNEGAVAVGSTRTVSVTRPGQDSRFTFTGAAGQTLGLEFTDYPMPYYPTVELLGPDGATLALYGVQASWSDLPALPADGTYTLLVSTNSGTGNYTLGLYLPQSGGALSLTGAGTSVSFTAGRAVTLTVPITSGDEFTVAFSNWTLPSGGRLAMSVSNPAGVVIHDTYAYSLSSITVAAATTGTYRVVLRPTAGATGSVLVTASPTIAAGAVTVGTAKTISSPRLGQPNRMTFTGAVGQRLSLSVSNYGYTYWAWARVTRPDGFLIYDGWLDDIWLAMEPFTQAGTYRLDIQPRAATTGSMTFTLVQAIDAGATTVGGVAKTLTASSAGRYVDTTMAVTANQRLSFGFTGWTFAATTIQIRLVGPSGQLILAEILPKESSTDTYQLPAGTYRLSVMASDRGSGAVTLTASAQISGGPWALNAAKTVSAPRAGQATWFTYVGTAGQNLAIAYTNVTMPYYPYVWVRRPNGEQLAWINGSATVSIPSLPISGTYEILISPYSFTGNATATLRTRTAAAAPEQLTPKGSPPRKIAEPAVPARNPAAGRAGPTAKKYPGGQSLTSVNAAAGDPAGWQPSRANLAGNGWSTGRGAPQKAADPVRAGPGVTALSGRVRTLDDTPLANVTVGVDGIRARTDAQGRFLLTGLRAGHRVLRVDGASASTPQRRFGLHDIGVDLTAGQTVVLPYTIWLSKLDTQHTVTFETPTKGEVTIGTPAIPGLEVKLPAGAVVRDVNGKVVTELGITAIPTDRAPFPLPRSQVPSYFTVQPGSSYVFPTGARVIYPNFTHAKPGAKMDFWHYDPAGKGWFIYGKGTVSPDGKRVTPDKGTEVYQFTGAMLITPGEDAPPEAQPATAGGASGGDPVDLGTGLLVDEHTDLALDDVMPISVTRTYQQADTGRRAFGIGAKFSYSLDLYSENRFYDCWLILPDGGRIRFHRISPGGEPPNGYVNGVFAADPTPTEFGGSILAWNGDGWDLRLRDGTTYVFGDEAPLQAIRDRHGNTVTITRAPSPPWTDGITRARGPITQVTSPNGKWIKFSYDADNRITRAEDVLGRAVTYAYENGRLSTVTDVVQGVTTQTYEDGRLKTIRDARGTVYLTNDYDASGRVIRQTMPGNAVYGFAYTTNAAGKIIATELTDPRGLIRRVTFDAGGYVTSDTTAHGTAAARTYTTVRDPDTHVAIAYVDPLNRRTELTYDAAGKITAITELAGTADARTRRIERNGPFGQVSRTIDALQRATTYGYQANGALRTVTDPMNRQVVLDTNEAGQVIRSTDRAGQVTQIGYQLGDAATVTDPLGNVSRAFTDSGGRVLSETDAEGNVSTAVWDAAGRLREQTDPIGRTTGFTYDANGNLRRLTDARDNTTVYEYDPSDQVTTVTDPLGRATTYTYDANGNTRTVRSPSGKLTEYAYDEHDSVSLVRFGVTSGGEESRTGYTYDAGGRLRTVTDSVSGTVTITPDNFNRNVQVAEPGGTVSYAYNAADQRTTLAVAGQPDTTYAYNGAGQLTTVARGAQTTTIAYDAAGRRDSLSLPGNLSQTYAYDDVSRLTGITYRQGGSTLGSIGYTLDKVGRTVRVTGAFARVDLPAESGPVTYDAADQRNGFTYDADGNLTSDGVATYAWNARNELTSFGGASYAYDAFGRRTGRTQAGVTTSYLYDGDNALQERTAGAISATILGGGLDEIFTRSTSGGSQSLLTDALGSTVATADGSAIAAEYTYDPFGATTVDGDDLGNPARFTGRSDDGNGLYHYRARYYAPGQQRFVSRDPIGVIGGINPYSYVDNQPTGLTDPMGTKPKKPCSGGGPSLPEDPDDPRKVIEDIARDIVEEGWDNVDKRLTPDQNAAIDAEGEWLRWIFRGSEVHKMTWEELKAQYPGKFEYHTVGPDFTHKSSGKKIELTTEKAIDAHKRKGKEISKDKSYYDPDYATCDYATYK